MAYEFARTGELVNLQRELELHPELIDREDDQGNTLLFYACSYGHLPIVDYILSLEYITRDIQDVFHKSIVNGHLPIVKKLLLHGASLNAVDGMNRTPLHKAVLHHHVDIVSEFLRRGASVNTYAYDNACPLLDAILNHNAEMVVLLLKYGAHVHFRKLSYPNALIVSMFYGNIEMIRMVLQTGKFENAKFTSIVKDAILYNPPNLYEVVELLLEVGFNPNSTSDGLDTALVLACKRCNAPLCELLLNYGANPNQGGYLNDPPILSAILYENEPILRSLIQHKVNVNTTTNHKEPVLNVACAKGYLGTVEQLVSAGATISLMTLISALRSKKLNVIECILQHIRRDILLDNESAIQTYLLTCHEGIVVAMMDVILDILHCTSIHNVWYALKPIPTTYHLIYFPTWYAMLPPPVKVEWNLFAVEACRTEVACYLALYEEQDTMVRFRRGEIVNFSNSSIRKLMRPYGARPIRNRVVRYLLHPYAMRLLFR